MKWRRECVFYLVKICSSFKKLIRLRKLWSKLILGRVVKYLADEVSTVAVGKQVRIHVVTSLAMELDTQKKIKYKHLSKRSLSLHQIQVERVYSMTSFELKAMGEI